MRSLALAAAALPALAVAGDGMLGTKMDAASAPVASGAAPMGAMPVVQMVVALGAVLALVKWGMPRLMGRFSKKLTANYAGGIQIEESASFAGGNLYVVSARGKTLLLSVASTGVNCLADLTESPTFEEMIARSEAAASPSVAAPVPTPAETAVIEVATPEANDAAAQLARLGHLVG